MKDKNLVIVESPTKAKTIGKILGSKFSVLSSMGHLIDLPPKELGVDIENEFKPEYEVIPGRQKILGALKKEAKDKAMLLELKQISLICVKSLDIIYHAVYNYHNVINYNPKIAKNSFLSPRT